MSARQGGMVLLTTISVIIILTMLVLSTLQSVFLYQKVRNQVELHHEILYRLEVAAKKIILEKTPSHCVLATEDQNLLIDRLTHHHGCALSDNGHQYVYMIGDLGDYPCLHLIYGNKIYSSHHWLVSIATAPPRQEHLQLRIAKPIEIRMCTHLEPRQIKGGVISWRHLPYSALH